MKIKLVKSYNEAKEGSICDCDEITGKELIDLKIAIEDKTTDAEIKSLVDKEVKKVLSIEEKQINIRKNKMETIDKKNEYMLAKSLIGLAQESKKFGFNGKLFNSLESKAVEGASEGGSHTGSDLVYTAITEMQGIWGGADLIWNKARKRTLPAGANSVIVPMDTFNEYAMGSAPVVAGVAEGGAKSVNAIPTTSLTIQPKVVQSVIAVTDELLEDVPYLDQYLRQKMAQKFANAKEQLLLGGAYGSTCGFYGVTDSGSAAYYTAVSTSATPTLAEMLNYEKAIDPGLRAGAEWVIGNAFWTTIKATFMTAANLQNNIIDPTGKMLLGYPVNVSANVNSIVLGNFNEYTVVESRKGEVIDTSIHVYFLTDQTCFRITSKLGGCPTYVKRTAVDSSTVGAFAKKA